MISRIYIRRFVPNFGVTVGDFFNDGLRGVMEFALNEAVILQNPDNGERASICELVCGGVGMGFYHVPHDLMQMRPVVSGMFDSFLPVRYSWQGTISHSLLPYVRQAMQPPGELSLSDAIRHVVGIFGSLKLLECHRLNNELLGLAHSLEDSVRNDVNKHVLIAPRIYQLSDFVDQYRVVTSVVHALLA